MAYAPPGSKVRTPAWNVAAVRKTWSNCAAYLAREVAYGKNQRDLLTVLEGDLEMHAAQWDSLREAVETFRPEDRRDIRLVIKNIYGDNFENVHSSTIINRSTVQSDLDTLILNKDDSLALALKEIASVVERLADPRASDLMERLISECAGPRRPKTISFLWNEIRKTAPQVERTSAAVVIVANSQQLRRTALLPRRGR